MKREYKLVKKFGHDIGGSYEYYEKEYIQTAYERNQKSVEAHIQFLQKIGGLKDVKELTPEFKEKMAEELERFWKETPMDMIAQIS